MTVRDLVYESDAVCDGFYDSISHLKTAAHLDLSSSQHYRAASQEYENILKICQEGAKVPNVSAEKTREILNSIRPSVADHASITGFHFRYGGDAALEHLHDLLNALINNLNNMSIDSLNTAWACILFKGHGKDRTSSESYRTISSCPFVSKALDAYIGDIYGHVWEKQQAETQFQGKGSSHDLAALLLTETIQFSLNSSKNPAYVLYLDARSAFDLVLKEFLINNLYHYGIRDQGLFLIDQRLRHRKTVCEWNREMMGPIDDQWGLEQGGKNSSEFYKVYNNEQLEIAQDSQLGIDIGGAEQNVVSAIGQADDVALVSDDIFSLLNLLQLSLSYCERYHVTLRSDKTKLQAFCDKRSEMKAFYAKAISPIVMAGLPIKFVDEAEHVGVLRSTCGNLPHIANRFSAHKKALGGVLPVGLARGHRGNPAASILIHNLYATPVLLSGISSLVLKSAESSTINQYLKQTTQRLLKLMEKTPPCVVAFLGGQLPGTALLHLRQLVLFGMIARMPDSVLHKHAVHILTSSRPSASSWFQQVRDLCCQYQLPHPLCILQQHPKKTAHNSLVKSKVVEYWEQKLRVEASSLESAPYFRADFMSLLKPHPLWFSCGSNAFECHKAVITARMLSGRYLTDRLQRHWTQNKAGVCLLPSCAPAGSLGTLEHLLLYCPALENTRQKLLKLCYKVSQDNQHVSTILLSTMGSRDEKQIMQILLDCSTIPAVIRATQEIGSEIRDRILYFGRTWCYNVHRERMNQLGLYSYR